MSEGGREEGRKEGGGGGRVSSRGGREAASLLHQLHDGVGVHEELVVFRSLLERHGMAVDDVGNLGRREEGGERREGEEDGGGGRGRRERERGRKGRGS